MFIAAVFISSLFLIFFGVVGECLLFYDEVHWLQCVDRYMEKERL